MEVTIPSPATIAAAGLTADGMAGLLDWSKTLLAWTSRWRLAAEGSQHRWAVRGVNVDAAFRTGVGGAAQIRSGHGAPG